MQLKFPFQQQQLGDLTIPVSNRDPRQSGIKEFRYVDIACVCNKTFAIREAKTISPTEAPSRARKVLQADDVIIATTRPYLRSIAIVPKWLNGEICSTGFCVLRAGSKILPEWIYYWVLSDAFMKQVSPLMRGANYPAVTDSDIRGTKIPLPPLDEQRRIVGRIKDCLSRVEEIERLRQESERETDQLHSAIFSDFVNSQLVDVTSVALGTVLKECKYGTSVKANVSGSGFPVLRMGNIKEGRLDITDLKHIDLPSAEMEKYFLSDGDILVNRTNSFELVGKSALIESLTGDWVYASYLIRLRVHTDAVLPEYVNGIINSRIGRAYVMRTARRAIGMVNINAEEIKRMPLPLPSLSIQRELVEKLKCAAPVIDRLSSEIDKKPIEGLRESILRKAFAGEL